jgi:hypothetical protein
MRSRTHLISSVAVGLALYPDQPARIAAVAAAGTLVDVDHLLIYALQTGDWSVVGALRYDRYRHRDYGWGDNRPRYGSLRSWLHRPELTLPLIWTLAAIWPALRPIAYGLSLHLLLDHVYTPAYALAWLRARGVCQRCGATGRRLSVHPGRQRRLQAICRACLTRARLARRGPHPV